MGNAVAAPCVPLPDLPSPNYIAISISGFDTLMIFYPGANELHALRTSIQENWPKGIQSETPKLRFNSASGCLPKAYSFKLKGNPFVSYIMQEYASMPVRRMCGAILQIFRNLGWQLLVSTDLGRHYEQSTWYFQRQTVQADTQKFFEIGLTSTDLIQIVDCPIHIMQVIKNVVSQTWFKGIQAETQLDQFVYQIKLLGNPWFSLERDDHCYSRFMIKEIISELSKQQWHLYGNSNLMSTADTLFFRFDPNIPCGEQFLMVNIGIPDRIRLIHYDNTLINLMVETFRQWWPSGIQEIIDLRPLCYEIKLKGNPWCSIDIEGIYARTLIVRIMEKMASVGFFVTTSVDVSRSIYNKSLLLFKRGQPLQTYFMCLSLHYTDTVRLINAPQNIIQFSKSLINNIWPLGVQAQNEDGISYFAKLKGNPWSSNHWYDGIIGRALMIHIIYHYAVLGWRLVCSADVSSAVFHQDKGSDYLIDVHSWYFMYDDVMYNHNLHQQQQVQSK